MRESDDGFDLCSRGGLLLRTVPAADTDQREVAVTPLYAFGGLLAAGLLVYLFVALLKPEIFS
jgi:K+-transporting ATPase KdpF subunit